METFSDKVKRLFQEHEELITRKNEPVEGGNGIFTRYKLSGSDGGTCTCLLAI